MIKKLPQQAKREAVDNKVLIRSMTDCTNFLSLHMSGKTCRLLTHSGWKGPGGRTPTDFSKEKKINGQGDKVYPGDIERQTWNILL